MFKDQITKAVVGCALACGLAFSGAAQAAPISYNSLAVGVAETGSVPDLSFSDPDLWSYFSLSVVAGQTYSVDVTRTAGGTGVGPAFAVWNGLENNTLDYFDLFSDTNDTPFNLVTNGFDSGPPFSGLASGSFVAGLSGTYAIAVAGDGEGPMNFSILISTAAPEPASLALLGLGLAGMGLRRRKS